MEIGGTLTSLAFLIILSRKQVHALRWWHKVSQPATCCCALVVSSRVVERQMYCFYLYCYFTATVTSAVWHLSYSFERVPLRREACRVGDTFILLVWFGFWVLVGWECNRWHNLIEDGEAFGVAGAGVTKWNRALCSDDARRSLRSLRWWQLRSRRVSGEIWKITLPFK